MESPHKDSWPDVFVCVCVCVCVCFSKGTSSVICRSVLLSIVRMDQSKWRTLGSAVLSAQAS